MKKLLAGLALASILVVPSLASADTPASEDGVTYLPAITIYGRPNRPSVVIELTRPTAARAASAAHEEMKAAWTAKTEPHPLR